MPETTEQVDHKAEALAALEAAREVGPDDSEFSLLIAEAQTHSNLAIAEGQQRVAEEIASLRGELHEVGRQINYLTEQGSLGC